MEKRIESIENDIKDINKKLGEHGEVNAVISSQMRGIHSTLKTLADNQSQLIALQATLEHLMSNCRTKGTVCNRNFDEAFTRLRAVELGKVNNGDMEKCKTDVTVAATKLVKPLRDRVEKIEDNQRWGVVTLLSMLGGMLVYAAKVIFGGSATP